jgi:Ca2+-binding RTX toxin-like protein
VVAQVVQYFQTHFSDPITVNIALGFGEVGGHQLSGGALGESSTYLSSFGYSTIKTALTGDAKTAADTSAVASLGSDPTGGTYWVSTAEGKALGLIGASTQIDGYVGFSSSTGIFDYNNTDGVGSGQYDFYGVVAHEISEVMGRLLLVGATVGASSNSYDPLDLFHFSSSGVHDFSGSTPGYFSVDGGATSLNTFNTVSGGDAGDWAGATIDAYNAFGSPGSVEPVSPADLAVLDAIGWDAGSSSPPPSGPDLTVSNFALIAGTTASFQVNNIGTDAGASTTGVYLSTDSAITTSDTLIGSHSTPSLAAGTSDPESTSLSFPSNLAPGTYYIGALADSGNVVAESNEANNASNIVPVILGNDSGNTLNGTAGNDTIFGFGGNDTLTGSSGNDTLVGGAGNDHFRFNARTDGLDTIVDFTSGTDVLDFSRVAFGNKLAGRANTGILDSSHFIANATGPITSAQEFWYNTTDHKLYYDADGSGAGAPVAMALLGVSTLSNTDIHLV